jgi:hypothetical protein
MAEGDTLLNALIGAVVGIVLSFVPFSTVLGGAVAGYLQGGDRAEGLRVGALSGAVMLVPIFLFATFFGGVFFFAAGGVVLPHEAVALSGAFALFALLFALIAGLVYVVGLAAVGGFLGNYVKQDTDVDL